MASISPVSTVSRDGGNSGAPYDRSTLTAGVIHIGVGNFFRAHQAWYMHQLLSQGLAADWAIIGAGVRPADAAMREKLAAQDFETTLLQLDPAGTKTEVVRSLIDFLPVVDGNAPLIAAMAAPNVRVVSLTITEGGYYQDANGALDVNHPDIVHDAEIPDHPSTAFGAIIAALQERRDKGVPPFSALCCDNIQENGDVLRQTVVGLARLRDTELADWIDANVAFPNSMVDCIVPATGPRELEMARNAGIHSDVPVTHENFRQWVIEDRFSAGRPPWEHAGVTLTSDVKPYESMKLRILNAGHQLLSNAGELLSLETIADCMNDTEVSGFLRAVQRNDILNHVEPVPDTTPAEYLAVVERRFSNPLLIDTTRRVAFDGSSRHPGFLHPILRDALEAGCSIEGLALAEALWARMCAGVREDGSIIEPNDPHWQTLQAVAVKAVEDPNLWIAQHDIYGDLSESAALKEAFQAAAYSLSTNGVRATLKQYIAATQ